MSEDAKETVGFIGLGNMGGPVARLIQKAGFPMVVYDLRREAMDPFVGHGAHAAGSPAEVARTADVTFTAVPMPRDVEAVALGPEGILEGIRENGIYVDISTSSPTLLQRLEPRFREKGAWVLDAPVGAGQPPMADPGIHEVMVGGPYAIFERVKPVFAAYGDQIIYAGELGSGAVCKLVHQMVGFCVTQAIAEGLTLGAKAGVAPVIVWEAIRRGLVGRMHFLHDSVPRTVFTGSYEPNSFPLTLLRKDIGLATQLGRDVGVPLPVANLVEQIAVAGINRGLGGGAGYTVTFQLQEEAAGTSLRVDGVDPDRAARYIGTYPDVELSGNGELVGPVLPAGKGRA
ncbi:MAG: NAD(P)-dependent oxidoreductase [Chloroflexota bacterium]